MKEIFKNSKSISGYIFVILATALWSGNFVIARGLSEKISPVNLAFFRWATAVFFLSLFAGKTFRKKFFYVKEKPLYFIITSVFGISIFNTMIYKAGHTTSAVNLALISIITPVFIVILSRFIFNEKITTNKTIGIIIVALGIINLISQGDISNLKGLKFAEGDIWMLVASFIFAVYSIMVNKKPEKMDVLDFQLSTFSIGLLFLFPFFIAENISKPVLSMDIQMLLSILYVGIFASVLAFFFWSKALLSLGPSRAGIVYYTLPLFSGFLGGVFLGESMGVVHLLSFIFIIAGIIIANYEF